MKISTPFATCVLGLALPLFAQSTQTATAVQTIEHEAPSVDRTMKYNIVLPEGYATSDKRYPTLYLLHGLTSNYTAWAQMRVPEYAAAYDLIVVMPDGGNSWYVNWAENEEGQKNNWEDYIIKDLIGHVDANYRTIAAREGRAINGLSMGGYGGLTLGLRHADMFCSIGSHSGALTFAASGRRRLAALPAQNRGRGRGARLALTGASARGQRTNPRIGIEGFSSQAERAPKGTMFATVEDCDEYDPFKLVLTVPAEKMPHIYIDCGTEDRLIAGARNLAAVLRENNIPFTYAESPGGHRASYWAREVGHSMAVQYAIIQRNLQNR